MRIGLALPQFDFSVPGENPLQWPTVVEWATFAERRGFDSLWIADHLFLDIVKYGGPPGTYGAFDPLVVLGALARETERVRLGTLVLCAPLRPATVLAKTLATIDVASNGRLIVGIGAGWYEPELALVGKADERPGVRLARLAESVQVLKGMFGGGPFSFDGTYESASNAWCLPRPVQEPGPPIWLGGKGDRLLELVARHADGWNTAWKWTPETYRQRLDVLDAACERVGRDPATVARSVGLYALVGHDEPDLARRFERLRELSPPGVLKDLSLADWRCDRLVGTVEQVCEQLAEWAALGIDTLVVSVGALPFAVACRDDVELFAESCSLSTNGVDRSN
ncbi:MAG TPA: TIGR03619 family F420-dependent LLM class oxidoreductase [Acidimicrobiales bacterium]|nr:TIGR03619 family F420-dependent LLM class oxidoreductase [Acidimicrobiales bacterium]